jgi:hypothetical protein
MSILAAASLAIALTQAPSDPETLLRAARDLPAATDAASERVALERIASGFGMRDVRIALAPAHTGHLHASLGALGASVQCHDVIWHRHRTSPRAQPQIRAIARRIPA